MDEVYVLDGFVVAFEATGMIELSSKRVGVHS